MIQISVTRKNTKPEWVARMFFLLGNVLGNTAICYSICHNQSLHRFSKYLVVPLVSWNLMRVAFFSLPIMRIHQSLHNTNWYLNERPCVLWIWTALPCRCSCFANFALIYVDGFVATRYPLKYRIIAQRGGQLMLIMAPL